MIISVASLESNRTSKPSTTTTTVKSFNNGTTIGNVTESNSPEFQNLSYSYISILVLFGFITVFQQ